MVTNQAALVKLLDLVDETVLDGDGRRLRGRPRVYGDGVMLKVFLLMTLQRIGTYQGLHRYLAEEPLLRERLGLPRLPSRRTLGRRLKSFLREQGDGAAGRRDGARHA
ncbi:MAG TPA: hypothetical protein VFV36_07125 [Candidatus Methylomirabilis sp.]|nr:hypothetical protein [Candidatus Methylomirabilis sp.]